MESVPKAAEICSNIGTRLWQPRSKEAFDLIFQQRKPFFKSNIAGGFMRDIPDSVVAVGLWYGMVGDDTEPKLYYL